MITPGTVRLRRGFDDLRQARRHPDGSVEYRQNGRWIWADDGLAQTFMPLPGTKA